MPLYTSYSRMRARCNDPKYHAYHRYGGRGIKIDERWSTWQGFQDTCPYGYEEGFTLDRIDNDGDYTPENCRWLPKEQNTKPFKVQPIDLLDLYESGIPQKRLAEIFQTNQPHISRLLKRARNG